jgi:hypothetical protein
MKKNIILNILEEKILLKESYRIINMIFKNKVSKRFVEIHI